MRTLSDDLIEFFHKQSFVIVSSLDKDGTPHSSCKGIVKINKSGRIYLLDLYKANTFENLKRNHHLAITAADEHKFKGFCLKGKAKIVREDKLSSHIINAWEKRLTKRITQRVLKNLYGKKGHSQHPEALFPQPEYLIVMDVQEIIDLTPHHLKEVQR